MHSRRARSGTGRGGGALGVPHGPGDVAGGGRLAAHAGGRHGRRRPRRHPQSVRRAGLGARRRPRRRAAGGQRRHGRDRAARDHARVQAARPAGRRARLPAAGRRRATHHDHASGHPPVHRRRRPGPAGPGTAGGRAPTGAAAPPGRPGRRRGRRAARPRPLGGAGPRARGASPRAAPRPRGGAGRGGAGEVQHRGYASPGRSPRPARRAPRPPAPGRPQGGHRARPSLGGPRGRRPAGAEGLEAGQGRRRGGEGGQGQPPGGHAVALAAGADRQGQQAQVARLPQGAPEGVHRRPLPHGPRPCGPPRQHTRPPPVGAPSRRRVALRRVLPGHGAHPASVPVPPETQRAPPAGGRRSAPGGGGCCSDERGGAT